MRGIIVTKDKSLKLVDDIPVPEIGPYEALVKIECCMICNGTDMEIIRGELPEAQNFPTVLGHESAGRVVATGNKVCTYKTGDMVLRASLPDSKKYCSSWGGFSEYAVVTDTAAMAKDGLKNKSGLTQQIVPEGISSIQASLMITLKETCSAIKRIGIKKEDTVLIVGDGPVGLCFLSDLRLLGIENIIMLGNRPGSLETAKRLGASEIIWNHNENDKRQFKEKYSRKVSVYIDTIGSPQTIKQGTEFVMPEGKIAVYGLRTGNELSLQMKGMRNFILQFVQWPIEESEMLTHDLIGKGIIEKKILTEELVSHVLPIEEFSEGFAAISEKRALKVALLF
ncbi:MULTISPECIES: zinc-dependent alcohol dehydrogenase [Clostridia]|uniref:zinc-dependent alcohol dehydrogenase n=1 Tax=Clostridia TaxID=186801 RepID=UPI0007406178|nr:zinc-binding dehydrogenase [Clostridium sp. C105KSO13]CUX21904.1 Sorbitol dehydrogenase [Clostridium sp. C105KSO13]